MSRFVFPLYGVASYCIFFVTFLYAIGFVGNELVPKTIDSGSPRQLGLTVLINILLLSLFAVQHTVMARPVFKDWWTQYVPEPIERSTFVLLSSLILLLIFWLWQPMPNLVWNIAMPFGRGILWALFWLGWAMVLVSTFLINHFDLFGLRQVYFYAMNKPYSHVGFKSPFLYQLVRHPIMLGFIIAFWATPEMSQGHLLFALVTTAYILIALQFEERDLLRYHGDKYEEYRQQVSMIVPRFRMRK